jgi:hypothetical protein
MWQLYAHGRETPLGRRQLEWAISGTKFKFETSRVCSIHYPVDRGIQYNPTQQFSDDTDKYIFRITGFMLRTDVWQRLHKILPFVAAIKVSGL